MMDTQDRLVSVPGAELHVSTQGRGPTCLVLSAIGSEPYARMTPPQLSDRLRLVFVELRGSGRSTGNPADLTFDVLAEDLDAIRIALGEDQIAILGHSIMGMLAIESGRRPGNVSHVIAVGTPPRGDMTSLAASSTAFFDTHASEARKQQLRDNLAALPEGASMGETMLAQTPMRFFDARFDAAPLFANAARDPGL